MASENKHSMPDEGGWRYVIVAATVVIIGTTVMPGKCLNKKESDFLVKKPNIHFINTSHVFLNNSNLIVDKFKFNPDDIVVELVNTISNSFLYRYISTISYGFSGILACFLLMRFSYRQVSFLGSIIFLIGAISRIFVQNFTELAISRGFITILGMGLLMSASLTALNSNFGKKIALIMCLHQTVVYVFDLVLAQLATWIEKIFDLRGTLIGLALLNCFCLPASAMLKPPPKQMIVKQEEQNENDEDEDGSLTSVLSLAEQKEVVVPRGDRIASKIMFGGLSEKLQLLKSYKYWNTIIGISLALIGDEFFFTFLPLLNQAINANKKSKFPLEPYSATELIFRILLTIVSAFVKFNSRLLMLFTSALVVIIRIALVPYIDPKSQLVLFECLKCFTQAPVPLVFSEEYKDNFTTAYSIFMVIYSVMNFIFAGFVHAALHCSDSVKKTEYISIAAYAICVIIWTLEFTFFRKKPINNSENFNENQ